MNKFISRQEIATDLGLPVPVVSQAIAAKILPVDENMGMVPRVWYKSSKITAGTIQEQLIAKAHTSNCLLYTSPSPRDLSTSRMPSSA